MPGDLACPALQGSAAPSPPPPSPALMTSALSAVARRAPGRRSCLPSARLINNLAKNVPRETYNQVLTAAPPLVILLVEGGFSARERYFRGTWHCYPARNPPGHSRLLIVAKPLHPPGGLGGRVFKEPCPLGGDYRTSHQAGIVLSADRSPSESEGSVAMPRSIDYSMGCTSSDHTTPRGSPFGEWSRDHGSSVAVPRPYNYLRRHRPVPHIPMEAGECSVWHCHGPLLLALDSRASGRIPLLA